MRAVIQRTDSCSVNVGGEVLADMGKGLLVLLGIETTDTKDDVEYLVKKIAQVRIFPDEEGIMNLDIGTAQGDLTLVSQFTLHASTKKGNRPSYIRAARPEQAIPLYEYFIQSMELALNKKIQTGKFGAMMDIALVNSGPVTIIMDSKNKE